MRISAGPAHHRREGLAARRSWRLPRRRPGADGFSLDFAEVLGEGASEPASTASWRGLRTASEWALQRGKLDTYLWRRAPAPPPRRGIGELGGAQGRFPRWAAG